jgi:phosphotransferase family enzyme
LSPTGAEAKPPWSAVPSAIKEEVAALLGSRVVRADRVYGGYGPSATFRLACAGGRRAFFKASYPLPKGSGVRWQMAPEARVYEGLGEVIRPWAPAFFGSFERDGWVVLLLEDLGPGTILPWTAAKAARAARSYARFHAKTLGRRMPRWVPRTAHHEFAGYWRALARTGELDAVGDLARRRAGEASEWLDVSLPVFRRSEARLRTLRGPNALLHFDTRSDNVRLQGGRLRIFDWPFASVGPAEFDLAAFAQSVAAEGGPPPEVTLAGYASVLPYRDAAMDASVAGIAGYFADRAWRPPVAGLPRLRSIQRRQLKASLAWAARRFALPEPAWLAAVSD